MAIPTETGIDPKILTLNEALLKTEQGARLGVEFAPSHTEKIKAIISETRRMVQELKKSVNNDVEANAIIDETVGNLDLLSEDMAKMSRNPGEFAGSLRRAATEAAIGATFAFPRSINDAVAPYSIDPTEAGKTSNDVKFNFPLLDRKVLVTERNIDLTIEKMEKVRKALEKLWRVFRGKYDAVIVVDPENKPIGLMKRETLAKSNPEETVGNLPMFVTGYAITMNTPHKDAETLMDRLGVNILPVLDEQTGGIIGILTRGNLTKGRARLFTSGLKIKIETGKATRGILHSDDSETKPAT